MTGTIFKGGVDEQGLFTETQEQEKVHYENETQAYEAIREWLGHNTGRVSTVGIKPDRDRSMGLFYRLNDRGKARIKTTIKPNPFLAGPDGEDGPEGETKGS